MVMQKCDVCNHDYNTIYKYEHERSVKHLQANGHYYCRKCNLKMGMAERDGHLNSEEHKSKYVKTYCDVCKKHVVEFKRHIESESHRLKRLVREVERVDKRGEGLTEQQKTNLQANR